MIHEALYSNRSEEWPTPEDFSRNLDIEFHFTLDPWATAQNAKCASFFTKSEDGLSKEGEHMSSSAILLTASRCVPGPTNATRHH
jgi:hypothetical protein